MNGVRDVAPWCLVEYVLGEDSARLTHKGMEGRGTEPGTRRLLGSTANGLKCSSQILLLPYSVDAANPNKLGFPKEIRHFH